MTRTRARRSGMLIAVEGLDGCGKTTFSHALAKTLGARWTTTPDQSVRLVRHAIDDGWAGSALAQRLFYAASVVACSDFCEPLITRGEIVVVDRYWASTLAYGALAGVEAPFDAIARSIRPADVTFFLDAPRGVRARRLSTRVASRADRTSLRDSSSLARAYDRALASSHSGRVVRLDARLRLEDLVAAATRQLAVSARLLGRPFSERPESLPASWSIHDLCHPLRRDEP